MRFILFLCVALFAAPGYAMGLLVPLEVELTAGPDFNGGVNNGPQANPGTLTIANCTAHGFTGTYYGHSVSFSSDQDHRKNTVRTVYAQDSDLDAKFSLFAITRIGAETCVENEVLYQYALAVPVSRSTRANPNAFRANTIEMLETHGNTVAQSSGYKNFCHREGVVSDNCATAIARHCAVGDNMDASCMLLHNTITVETCGCISDMYAKVNITPVEF